jgi:hypothetical protein
MSSLQNHCWVWTGCRVGACHPSRTVFVHDFPRRSAISLPHHLLQTWRPRARQPIDHNLTHLPCQTREVSHLVILGPSSGPQLPPRNAQATPSR